MQTIDSTTVQFTPVEARVSEVYDDLLDQGYNHVEAGYTVVSLFPTVTFEPEFLQHLTTGAMTIRNGLPKPVPGMIAASIDLGEQFPVEPYVGQHRNPLGPVLEPHVDQPEPLGIDARKAHRARVGLPVPAMTPGYFPEVAGNR